MAAESTGLCAPPPPVPSHPYPLLYLLTYCFDLKQPQLSSDALHIKPCVQPIQQIHGFLKWQLVTQACTPRLFPFLTIPLLTYRLDLKQPQLSRDCIISCV